MQQKIGIFLFFILSVSVYGSDSDFIELLKKDLIIYSNVFNKNDSVFVLNHIETAGMKRFEIWKEAAELGIPEGQILLSLCYYYGAFVHDNYEKAFKWTREAAKHGHVIALHNLGECYSIGAGVSRDHHEATKWFRKAAEHGFAESQYGFYLCYLVVDETGEYDRESAKWLRAAAEQGHVGAQHTLGRRFYDGVLDGIPRNIDECIKWLTKASEQGDVDAQETLTNIIKQNNISIKIKSGAIESPRSTSRIFVSKRTRLRR